MAFKNRIEVDLMSIKALALHPNRLQGALYLRCFERKDELALISFYKRNAHVPFFGVTSEFKGDDALLQQESARKFIHFYTVAFEKQAAFHYGLFEQTDNTEKLVGRLGLTPRYKMITSHQTPATRSVWEAHTCDIGVFMDQSAPFSYGQKGYTKAAIEALLKQAQQNGYDLIDAVIHKENIRSAKLFKTLGFVFPAQKRNIIDVRARGYYYEVDLDKYDTAHGCVSDVLKTIETLKTPALKVRIPNVSKTMDGVVSPSYQRS